MNSYDLSRNWFDYCFENPEIIKPNHTALYFFCIEHCNRLGWKEKYGLPSTMAKEAIGIRSYNTYINTLNDLVSWGFIRMVERAKNQYSANIIALSNFNKALDKAHNKALDKALIKHGLKQSESTVQSTGESTVQSIDSINKQRTINKEQENKEQEPPEKNSNTITDNQRKVIDRLMQCFGFTEIKHPAKLFEAGDFISAIDVQEKLQYFTAMLEAYMKYKSATGEIKHTWKRFMGSPDQKYLNGAWNAENWTHKLNSYINDRSNRKGTNGRSASLGQMGQGLIDAEKQLANSGHQ